MFFPRNGPALSLVTSEAVKLSSCVPAIRRNREVQSRYLNKAANTGRFNTDIQHTLGSRDFFGKAQQPLFAFCNGNTLEAGLGTQDVSTAQLMLGAMPGSPSSAPLFAAGEGTRQSSLHHQAGWSAAKAAEGCAERCAGKAQRAPGGRGCRALLAPALRHGVEKCFLLGVGLRKGSNQGRSHSLERGGQAGPPARVQEGWWFKPHGHGQDPSVAPQCDTAEIPVQNRIKTKQHGSAGKPRGAQPRRSNTGSAPKPHEQFVLPPDTSHLDRGVRCGSV